MTKKHDPTEDEKRRDESRRQILMPIHDERRRGRDRRKSKEARRSSGVDPLPMARLSAPSTRVSAPKARPRSSSQPAAIVPDSAAPPQEATRTTPPGRTLIPEPPVATARPTSTTATPKAPRRATVARQKPSAAQPGPVPSPAPLTPARKKPKSSKASKPRTKKKRVDSTEQTPKSAARPKRPPKKPVATTPPKNSPTTGSEPKVRPTPAPPAPPRAKVAKAKPKPQKTPNKRSPTANAPPKPTPKPARIKATRRSRQSAAYANGELWIGVPEDELDVLLVPRPVAETHRFAAIGSGRQFLVTVCHGPVGTVYRAWRPVSRESKQGDFLTMKGKIFQQIGSNGASPDEFRLARQTIFAAFPEIDASDHTQDKGAVITVDV